MPPKLCFVLGTRPEIIKLSPLIRICLARDIPFSIVHTGQHYSNSLNQVFFDQLDLPTPDVNLNIGSGPHGRQTGEMITELEQTFEDRQPDIVLLQGDTNTVLAGGVTASKMDRIQVAHVEAGLRSYDMKMPEEINRRLVDHVSDFLFAPTEAAQMNLLAENLPKDRVTVTGNTIVDAVKQHVSIAYERSDIKAELNIDGQFGLLTAHREENVDDRDRFASILTGVSHAASANDLSIIYPIHPRAKTRIEEFNLEIPDEIQLVDPLDFLDFLVLEAEAAIVFTDSGGVQEETCILRTPCITIRDSTERPETVDVGANRVVGVCASSVVEGTSEMLDRTQDWENPFGDGTAAERIIDQLVSDFD